MTDQKTDCVFCKIIAGTIPAEKVYEDPNTYAFLDAHPNTKGHTLIVPREHHANLLETPDKLRHELIDGAINVAQLLKTRYGASGMNITTNIGSSAGQIVFHTHLHIIPRY